VLTWLLLALNAAVFLFELSLGSQLEPFIRRWGLVPADVVESPAVWITLLTSTFVQAGWLHLASNMLYLGVFGLPVERRMGTARFAGLYFGSAVAGSVALVLAQPSQSEPAVGASGAIAGIIAAHLVLFPNATLGSLAPVLFLRVVESTPVVLLLIIWLVAQLLSGLTSLTTSTSIAWWAHLGGFAMGLTLATVLRGRRLTRTKY
jgi:membrane associated rhomboid family serine protease